MQASTQIIVQVIESTQEVNIMYHYCIAPILIFVGQNFEFCNSKFSLLWIIYKIISMKFYTTCCECAMCMTVIWVYFKNGDGQ